MPARCAEFEYRELIHWSIRAGTELPVNFHLIRLNRGQMEKLEALGIHYEQE